jgi:RHS repeat-associated protein
MMKIYCIKISAVIFCCFTAIVINAQRIAPFAYNSTTKVNSITSWDAKAPQVDPTKIQVGSSIDSFLMVNQFIDGAGNTIQTVARQNSPLGKDLITPVVYDEFGREQNKYLPFVANNTGNNSSITDGLFKLNPFQQDSSFSKTQFQGENYYYSQTIFEQSELNRIANSYPQGDSWVGSSKGTGFQYLTNSVSDSVRIWSVSSTISAVPTSSSFYSAGQLFKNISTDENGKQLVEYKDKEGKVILKKVQILPLPGTAHVGWLSTYYVYDNLNNVRFVIQPSAVGIINGNWSINTTVRDELCFYYGYDNRNRMTIKKVPGAGEVWMVYDKRDRLSMTQDANLRAAGKWMIIIYDDQNRPLKTGLWTNSGDLSYHQSLASTTSNYYYPFNTEPTSGWELLTDKGYDVYSIIPAGAPSANIDATYINSTNFFTTCNSYPDYALPLTQSMATRGMVTWTKVKVLGSSSTFLYTTNIYDEKGRVIQVKSTNFSGGTDISTSQYNFSGKGIRSLVVHQKSGVNAATYLVLSKNVYDATGRLISIKKSVNGGTEKTISQLSYDELGQLKTKKLAAEYNSGAGLETLTYDYNIRGWILGANRDYAKSTSSTSNYFGFDLGYDKTDVSPTGGSSLGSYAVAQYNGNIGGMLWKSMGDGQIRKYDFAYDAVNRLTGADFNQYTSGFNKTAGLDFSVSNLTYDANGNILTQNQKGWKLSGNSYIDQLSYSYQGSSNKLQFVTDASNDNGSKLGDFKYDPATKTSTDYSYDGNGNLTLDNNKKISSVSYNHLNLPTIINVSNKGTIVYTYDATGNKLQKQVTEGSKVTTTLYLYGTYVNDTLEFLPQEEGMIRRTTDVNNPFTCDYFLKDHLANVRMVLTEEQKTNAYPPASMETAQATTEEAIYSNLPTTRVSLPSGYPTDTYTSPNAYVAKVNGIGNKIGPAIVLKVMAGDKFNIRVSSWYNLNGGSPGSTASPLTDLVNALCNSIGAISTKASSSELSSNSTLNSPVQSFLNNEAGYTISKPKAFVNWILFDEQFKYVGSSSNFDQVGGDQEFKIHQLNNLPINKNGYLYVYVSNETTNIDVFFDNLQVTHIRGPLLEETHYYPFGLTMSGISSRAASSTEAMKKFQGQEISHNEFTDGSGLDIYGFKYRFDDPQIGRFWQIDPLAAKYVYNSTYAFSENKVINGVELEGLEVVTLSAKYEYLAGIVGGEAGYGIAVGPDGIAYFETDGFKIGAGGGGSVGLYLNLYGISSVKDVYGSSTSIGVSGGFLGNGGVEAVESGDNSGLGISGGIGGGGYISFTRSDTRPISSTDFSKQIAKTGLAVSEFKDEANALITKAIDNTKKNISALNNQKIGINSEINSLKERYKSSHDSKVLNQINNKTDKLNELQLSATKLKTNEKILENARDRVNNLKIE